MSATIDMLEKANERLAQQVATLTAEREQLQRDLAWMASDRDATQADVTDLQADVAAVILERDALREELAKERSYANEAIARGVGNQFDRERLERELAEARELHAETSRKLVVASNAAALVDDLRKSLAETEKERDKEHQKYLTKAAALAEVRADLDALREEIAAIQANWQSAAPPAEGPTWQPIEGPNAFMQGQLDAARAEIARLEQKCDERFLEGIKHEQRRLCR